MVAALAAPAAAQLPRIGVPKGQLRVEIGASFDGVNDELSNGTHPLHDAWNGDLGSALDGNLSVTEAAIQSITGNSGYRLSAGRSRIKAQTSTGTAIFSAAIGVTSRLTLYGSLPFVRARWQTNLHLDSTTANAGFNPADPTFGDGGAGAAAITTMLTQMSAALAALQTHINNGDYDGNPPQKALAIQTVADGTALAIALTTIYTGPGSSFVPTDTSAAAIAIRGKVDALQSTLSGSFAISSFTADPVFALKRLGDDGFRSYLTDGAGPVQAILRGDQFIQRQGDLELGASYTLIDRPALRIAATGLVRLPTGFADRTDNFFDLGTGSGVWQTEGRLAADLTRGRLGARVSGGYNRIGSLTRTARPSVTPIAYKADLAGITFDQGDVLTLGVEPFLRLAPGFAVALGAFRQRRGADALTFTGSNLTAPGAAPRSRRSGRSGRSAPPPAPRPTRRGRRG